MLALLLQLLCCGCCTAVVAVDDARHVHPVLMLHTCCNLLASLFVIELQAEDELVECVLKAFHKEGAAPVECDGTRTVEIIVVMRTGYWLHLGALT